MKKKKARYRAAYAACNKLCKSNYTNVQTAPLEGYTVVPGEENRTAGGVEGVLSSSYFFAPLDFSIPTTYYKSTPNEQNKKKISI